MLAEENALTHADCMHIIAFAASFSQLMSIENFIHLYLPMSSSVDFPFPLDCFEQV